VLTHTFIIYYTRNTRKSNEKSTRPLLSQPHVPVDFHSAAESLPPSSWQVQLDISLALCTRGVVIHTRRSDPALTSGDSPMRANKVCKLRAEASMCGIGEECVGESTWFGATASTSNPRPRLSSLMDLGELNRAVPSHLACKRTGRYAHER